MSVPDGLMTQFQVVHALVLRETRTRFGQHKLGYVWAILEPVLFIATFYILFEIGGRTAPDGMNLFGFMATGILPYFFFTNTLQQVAASISGNKALLFYPQVNTLDLVLARGFLELGTYGFAFIVVMGAHTLTIQEFAIESSLYVIIGCVLASLLGGSLGLVFCALGQFSKLADRARGPLLRPLFWVSGVFFTANSLPPSLGEAFSYNPLLPLVELVRDGWFQSYHSRYLDITYSCCWILAFSFMGLTLERVVRRRIEVT